MPYCTLDDIKALLSYERLLQLCDDDDVGEVVVDPPNTAHTNIVAAIAEGDAIIDSKIAGRYTLPLTEPYPVQVAKCSANLAVCALYDRRREMDVPEGVERRRKQWLKWLDDVQANKAEIPDLDEATTGGGYSVSRKATDRIFTDDLLSRM